MLSKYLKDGQKFTVDPPDREYPVRVCLENTGGLIIWGFPVARLKDFWSMMGGDVDIELLQYHIGQNVFMTSIKENGVIKKIRKDDFGVEIFDVLRLDQQIQLCRENEIEPI